MSRDLAPAALPILQAPSATYHVVKVIYDDGTVWTPASAAAGKL